jgi:hypothetical protein
MNENLLSRRSIRLACFVGGAGFAMRALASAGELDWEKTTQSTLRTLKAVAAR